MTSNMVDSRRALEASQPPVLLIGVDHRCAPLELREKIAYSEEEANELLTSFQARDDIDEACLLSTCNRTEIYLLPRRQSEAYRTALEHVFLTRAPEIEAEGRFYVKRGREAMQHLFEVASGLQSMVLGEPEILGQVRRAAQNAEDLETSGTVLRRLLRGAVAAGGKARTDTAIGNGAISFGYAIVDLARSIFHRLDSCSVLILGAGETARQVARNLIERGAKEIVVANRGRRRADELRTLFPEVQVIEFEERRAALERSDLVIACTAAELPILERRDFERAMASRRARPLLAADLGVPRNLDPAAGELDNLFLQDVDSLEQLIGQNLRKRRDEIPRVQEILDRELGIYAAWFHGLAAEPLVAQLQRHAEQIRQHEVASSLGKVPSETHESLNRLTRSLVRKILHHPSSHLRSGDPPDMQHLEAIRELFRLDDD
ncbi:MAG: glutamyl-tRNA reductase [Acidobacteriota bacterium]